MLNENDFFKPLYQDLERAHLSDLAIALKPRIDAVFASRRHGKLDEWLALLDALPGIVPSSLNSATDAVRVGVATDSDQANLTELEQRLHQLHPWRKGPYSLFGIDIDSEWHSDWKWQRIVPHLASLANRRILDVGCGNGYHLWRMLGEQARLVIGVDPSQFFLIQFQLIRHYAAFTGQPLPIHLVPLKSEEFPALDQELKGCGFDTVFSMGVLYHRPSPIHHLQELKRFLRPGGELVLETLVIASDQVAPNNQVLIPADRYAKMRNVWFIPTTDLLERMLQRVGFHHIRVVDINRTSTTEQRRTDWMQFESLADFLDPNDPAKTIEGYPSPVRAVLIANMT